MTDMLIKQTSRLSRSGAHVRLKHTLYLIDFRKKEWAFFSPNHRITFSCVAFLVALFECEAEYSYFSHGWRWTTRNRFHCSWNISKFEAGNSWTPFLTKTAFVFHTGRWASTHKTILIDIWRVSFGSAVLSQLEGIYQTISASEARRIRLPSICWSRSIQSSFICIFSFFVSTISSKQADPAGNPRLLAQHPSPQAPEPESPTRRQGLTESIYIIFSTIAEHAIFDILASVTTTILFSFLFCTLISFLTSSSGYSAPAYSCISPTTK